LIILLKGEIYLNSIFLLVEVGGAEM